MNLFILKFLALLKASKKREVKGTLPLGCLPLWGREGVTLIITKRV